MESNCCSLAKLATYLYGQKKRCMNAYSIHIVMKLNRIVFCIENARLRNARSVVDKCYIFFTLSYVCKQCYVFA